MQLAGTEPGTRRATGLITQSDRLVERAESSTPELRAGVLGGMANDALMTRGDLVAAADLASQALAEGPVTTGALAMSYATLAMCALADAQFERAREIVSEGQRAIGELRAGVLHSQAFFEMLIAQLEGSRGDQAAAQIHARDAVRLARDAKFPYRLSQALNTLANASRYDDLEGARRAANEAAGAARAAEVTSGLGNAIMTQAELSALSGAPREAISLMRDATIAWGDDVASMIVVRAAARACRLLADFDALRPATVLGAAASAGIYSHLLLIAVDQRGRDDLHDALAQLRASLGAEAFDADAARGAAMSSDAILRFIRTAADEALRD